MTSLISSPITNNYAYTDKTKKLSSVSNLRIIIFPSAILINHKRAYLSNKFWKLNNVYRYRLRVLTKTQFNRDKFSIKENQGISVDSLKRHQEPYLFYPLNRNHHHGTLLSISIFEDLDRKKNPNQLIEIRKIWYTNIYNASLYQHLYFYHCHLTIVYVAL